MKLNKTGFINMVLEILSEGEMLIVEQTIPNQHRTEYICNKNKNILNKLKYYSNYYNEDLTHKSKQVKIVNVFGVPEGLFEEFPKDLEGIEENELIYEKEN